MANGHGGARENAGRKRRPAYVPDGGETPLDYLIKVMRAQNTPRAIKIECAAKAAPYCHARLLAADIQSDSSLHVYLVSQLADIPAESNPA